MVIQQLRLPKRRKPFDEFIGEVNQEFVRHKSKEQRDRNARCSLQNNIFWRFVTDFSFLVCHNKCVSMLKRFHTKINVLRKIFAGYGVYKADDVFRRAYCYLFLTCTGGTVWTS